MRRLLLGPAAVLVALALGAAPAAAQRQPTALPDSAAGGPAAQAAGIVEAMTTQERAASIVMGHIPTQDAAELTGYMQSSGIGGFILMGANVPGSQAEVRTVTSAVSEGIEVPPLIAIDQEGGDVSRLSWDAFPAARTLKESSPAETGAAFASRAALVAAAGANVNFGVVADTTPDASSFIFGRSLGADPVLAADRVAAAVTAEEPLVASTLKHFPGHGAAPGDSHELIPSTTETLEQWRESDALPFIAGIDAGASLLMFGHLAYTAVDDAPASLSERWHEIARDELGFEGVIVTDDLGMLLSTGMPEYADPIRNAVRAVAAGTDLVLMIVHSTPETAAQLAAGIATAVEDGEIAEERLQDAAERVMTLRLELAASGAVWAPCDDCEPAS
ncbi:glycoside hydrolase family 3 N-terminal domain-containing protein [Microbacterium paludicola]|uniref:glycoside hydrolase family 3 N-terminal domain-containing protein n=1 Tax=Microbacterium paludicola TaxID=300019 RepID=UPI0021B575DB|nr:glycoside hydrolase family 3 N-terminal domain-containing protein [Microbacterium paludicola]